MGVTPDAFFDRVDLNRDGELDMAEIEFELVPPEPEV
jgi:hypothetical protein